MGGEDSWVCGGDVNAVFADGDGVDLVGRSRPIRPRAGRRSGRSGSRRLPRRCRSSWPWRCCRAAGVSAFLVRRLASTTAPIERRPTSQTLGGRRGSKATLSRAASAGVAQSLPVSSHFAPASRRRRCNGPPVSPGACAWCRPEATGCPPSCPGGSLGRRGAC